MAQAIGYLRKSSGPARRDRTVSFEMQEAAVRDLAAGRGDALGLVLGDYGKSGGTGKRPDYQRLLSMVDAGEVTTIYSFSLSRLSRSLIDFAMLLERCRVHGVGIRLVQEGDIDWTCATGRAFASMAAVFAQFERELGAERNQAAAAERRERGDHLGQAPYGYRLAAGRLVPTDNGENIEAVFDAFRQAGTFGGTARHLNAWGVPTRRHGTHWNHGTVARILRQQAPADLGVAVRRSRAGSKPLARAKFHGLLHCPCGGTLTPRRPLIPTHDFAYYCSRAVRDPDHGRVVVRERVIQEWAEAEAARLRVPFERVRVAQEAQAKLRQVEERKARAVGSYIEGLIDKTERDRRLSALADEEQQLSARSAAVTVPTLDWDWPPDRVNTVLKALWAFVELDRDLLPVRAEWLVPEWRQPE